MAKCIVWVKKAITQRCAEIPQRYTEREPLCTSVHSSVYLCETAQTLEGYYTEERGGLTALRGEDK